MAPAGRNSTGTTSIWHRLLEDPLALAGLVTIVVVTVAAIAAPALAPFDPTEQFFDGPTLEGAPLPPNERIDKGVMVVSFAGVSAPQFVVGLLLLSVFANLLGWFPLSGFGTVNHLILPALTLGIAGGGWYSRMMRSSMVRVLRHDYIRTARAKGLSGPRIVVVHALRNAILPVVAMIGLDIGIFMSGVVVVESVFGWPGIGQLAWLAIQRIDIPIIMGVTLVAAVAIVIGNLLADLAAPLIDPHRRQIYNRIMDDAPCVPVFNEVRFAMHSARIGDEDIFFADPTHIPVHYEYVYAKDAK